MAETITLQRMLSDEQCTQLRQLMEGAEHVVLCCHHNPDGDAVGSMAAATLLLQRLGKKSS